MPTYSLNPYISFIENRLFAGVVQRAIFHRLTGVIIETSDKLHAGLLSIRSANGILLNEAESDSLRHLIEDHLLIPEGFDPLAPLLDHYVTRPIQNPAVAYRSHTGEWTLVRTSMEHAVYSRKLNELPPVIEENL